MNEQPPIRGIIPPIITPFTHTGEVDFDAFAHNCERWNSEPLGGLLVLGSNSEAPYLNEEEKLTLIRLAVRSSPPGRIVLAGTGLESTRETIRLTNLAASLGAHAALVLTPFYYGEMMSEAAVIRHYTAIAEASDIPILLYNVPRFTHYNIPAGAVAELSRHPGITGMKDSSGNLGQLKEFISSAAPGFTVIPGSASLLPAAAESGVETAIIAIANAFPGICARILNRPSESASLHSSLMSVSRVASDRHGIPGLKYLCTLAGYEGGYPRSPLQPLGEDAEAGIRAALDASGLLQHASNPSGQEA